MRKQIVAALLAAASLMPGIAAAQDMDRQVNRAERMAQREARQQQRAERAPDQQPQARPQSQAQPQPQPQERQQARRDAPAGGWQMRDPDRQTRRAVDAQPGGWQQQQRPDATRQARRDAVIARDRDRQGVQAGTLTREAYRQNRQALQRPEVQDRRADRRDRNGGRWSNERRWAGTYADRNDRWNDRDTYNGRSTWNHSDGWRNDDRDGWNRGWRGDNRYDWNRYRTQNRSAFRLPRYYAPYGWNNGYRRFSIGARLSQVLFSQNYWIDDPWSYRLPEADGPYRWVRYYNDALLVDLETGEVVDTIEGIFW